MALAQTSEAGVGGQVVEAGDGRRQLEVETPEHAVVVSHVTRCRSSSQPRLAASSMVDEAREANSSGLVPVPAPPVPRKSLSAASNTVTALAPEICRWSPMPWAVPPSVRTRHLATNLVPLAPQRPFNSSSLSATASLRPSNRRHSSTPSSRGVTGADSKWTTMAWSGPLAKSSRRCSTSPSR